MKCIEFCQKAIALLRLRHSQWEPTRKAGEHPFMGTIHRYIVGSKKHTNQVEIAFVWRSSVMPDEATREQALEEFRQALDDVLDWSTASYDEGTVFMHA